jgi:glutathione S-transferase
MMRALDVLSSLAASTARAGLGMEVGRLGSRPARTLELYDFEGCPYCRKVREALSILDLDAIVYPCPKGGVVHRRAVERRGGKQQFPYLVDPNAGVEFYESDAIVRHLFDRYGDGRIPFALSLGILGDGGSMLASALRLGAGVRAHPARQPERLLEVYSFEASPFCRLVRETLTRLELPYLLHNVAKGSPKREAFVRLSGKMMVPYLVDPNTGVAMFESAEIVAYLERTYGTGERA